MAVFHHTTPEHHSLSAVKAAVQMKRFVKKLNHNRTNLGLFTINIGIGISTGTVLLGDVGSSRRKDLTVIGDEVNLASRLESASKKGRHSKIIFSGSTHNLVKDFVEAEEMPFTEIRGKQQAVKIFELIKLNLDNV
jgi:class 3 adenylate cyclase